MSNVKTHDRVCKAKGIDKDTCHETNMYMDKPARHHPGCKHRNYRHHKDDCETIKKDIDYLTNDKKLAEDARKSCNAHIDLDNLIAKETNSCGCPNSSLNSEIKLKESERISELLRSHRKDFLKDAVGCDLIEHKVLSMTNDKDLAREAKDRCTLYKNLIKNLAEYHHH